MVETVVIIACQLLHAWPGSCAAAERRLRPAQVSEPAPVLPANKQLRRPVGRAAMRLSPAGQYPAPVLPADKHVQEDDGGESEDEAASEDDSDEDGEAAPKAKKARARKSEGGERRKSGGFTAPLRCAGCLWSITAGVRDASSPARALRSSEQHTAAPIGSVRRTGGSPVGVWDLTAPMSGHMLRRVVHPSPQTAMQAALTCSMLTCAFPCVAHFIRTGTLGQQVTVQVLLPVCECAGCEVLPQSTHVGLWCSCWCLKGALEATAALVQVL